MVQRNELDESSPLEEKAVEILRTEKCDTIKELVRALERDDKSIPIEQIQEAVRSLERNGKVVLNEALMPESFIRHVTKNYFDNIALWIAISVISFAFVAIYGIGPDRTLLLTDIRVAAGVVALLFLPGYGVLTLLFSGERMSSIERVGISFILSLIMILILFLFIENLPVVAGRDTFAVSISIIGFLLILFGTYRQYVIKHNKFMLHAQNGAKNSPTTLGISNNPPSSDIGYESNSSSIITGDDDGSSGGGVQTMAAEQSSSDESGTDIPDKSLGDTDDVTNHSNGITSSPQTEVKSGRWI